MNSQILLVFPSGSEESAAMLKGIIHYQRLHRTWTVSLREEALAEHDQCWVRSHRWHGVISRNTTPALIQTCGRLFLPLVDLCDTPVVEGVSKIRPDNIAIGHIGAEYFMERRFRCFGFCGFGNRGWSRERREGFLESLGLAGHRAEVFDIEKPAAVTPSWEAKQSELLVAWLRYLPKESAVMACDDRRAQQIVRAAQVAGLQVPEEVAVLGVNNDVMQCELADPAISSVAVNAFDSGYRAAEHLDACITGGKARVIDLRIEPAGIITRKSTDVLALRDKNVASALSFITAHACEGITVDQVVDQASMSRSQLEHKFRRYLGRSPQVEIRRAQVSRISQLLAETNLPLKDIADQTGFVHVEYMCVVFKRITGLTPGNYRSKYTRSYESPCFSK